MSGANIVSDTGSPGRPRARALPFPQETQAGGCQLLFEKHRGELRQVAAPDSPAHPI